LENWQDPFIDHEFINKINKQEKAGERYLQLLKNVFPIPLERAEKCMERSVDAFRMICKICS
jgi:hypothetical protein